MARAFGHDYQRGGPDERYEIGGPSPLQWLAAKLALFICKNARGQIAGALDGPFSSALQHRKYSCKGRFDRTLQQPDPRAGKEVECHRNRYRIARKAEDQCISQLCK